MALQSQIEISYCAHILVCGRVSVKSLFYRLFVFGFAMPFVNLNAANWNTETIVNLCILLLPIETLSLYQPKVAQRCVNTLANYYVIRCTCN
jgi:hypothetical protein